MPEGPEVRRYADTLQKALAGKRVTAIDSRLKVARRWLGEHPGELTGRRIERVRAHGKNLIIELEDRYFIHSHLMMWGRWQIVRGRADQIAPDRRERARIGVAGATALLYSAPVFEFGRGDPYRSIPNLATLGPDCLPETGPAAFDAAEFRRRLLARGERGREIGAALLDQRIVAGIGNYLRAEILFICRLDPWIRTVDLTGSELNELVATIPEVCARAYRTGGITVPADLRKLMLAGGRYAYRPDSEFGSRHFVFRRTNLPCFRCGTGVKQLRQVTLAAGDDEGEERDEKSRIIYFCPTCQATRGANSANPRRMRTLSTPFTRFAETAYAIGSDPSRNEKARVLGGYLRSLPEADLPLATRFFAGDVFPQYDQRTTQIGGASLLAAVAAAAGVRVDDLKPKLVLLGDPGDVAGEALGARVKPDGEPPTLAELYRHFEELAVPRQKSKDKVAAIAAILARLEPEEAKYYVRLLAGDLRIGLKEGAVEAALAQLHDVDPGRISRANLLTGDIGEVAARARAGTLDDAEFRMFHPLKFMLASPSEDDATIRRSLGDSFLVEHKFDGIRAQIHLAPEKKGADAPLHGVVVTPPGATAKAGVRVAIFSRTMDEITESFPELLAPLAEIGRSKALILDGEILPLKAGKALPFLQLQKRLGRKKVDEALLRDVPCSFVAFDLLLAGRKLLLDESLRDRRAALDQIGLAPFDPEGKVSPKSISASRALMSSGRIVSDTAELDAAFTLAREAGNEGLMLKDLGAIYKPGRRGKEWLKVKRTLATLDVVVTSVEVGNGRRRNLLSDFTFAVRKSADDPTLLNVGKAYSGLTDAELTRLTQWFKEHTRETFAHGKVRVVDPQIVIEVTFDAVQESKRHKGGYALRFPRIVRLREDKPVSEIDTIEAVRALAAPGSASPTATGPAAAGATEAA